MTLGIANASIVQLCSVPAGLIEKKDGADRERTVAALALVELEVYDVEDPDDTWVGREIWPVICGYGRETDHLRLWTPSSERFAEGHEPAYAFTALGDRVSFPLVGPRVVDE